MGNFMRLAAPQTGLSAAITSHSGRDLIIPHFLCLILILPSEISIPFGNFLTRVLM